MSEQAAKPKADAPTPPEERFWKRYSPHGEAPLSAVGSFTIHLLVGGLLVLALAATAAALAKTSRNLPIEPVRLKIPGGGGGHKQGTGDGPNIGGAEDVGQEGGKDEFNIPGINEDVPKVKLTPAEVKTVQEKFAPEDARYIARSNSETAKALARLEDGIRKKITPGPGTPGKGQGGSGQGGGKDKGKGKGVGPGEGDGKATLTQREKRMLRWHMRFTANNGREYVEQLRALGAILAFPTREGADPDYKLVRDLHPKAKLLSEDLSNIQRIYWIDDKPRSVNDVCQYLGLNIRPSRFVAFMPEELEADLYRMERNYVEKVLRRKFDEELIDETNFVVVFKGGKYRPELLNVQLRR
jgi:hypothetical protein